MLNTHLPIVISQILAGDLNSEHFFDQMSSLLQRISNPILQAIDCAYVFLDLIGELSLIYSVCGPPIDK